MMGTDEAGQGKIEYPRKLMGTFLDAAWGLKFLERTIFKTYTELTAKQKLIVGRMWDSYHGV